jgi:3-hydroxyacyl-[acyl-carrier-protein] dehydratase
MSRLTEELLQCMSDLADAGENQLTARFRFPAGFTGFKGHFPEAPILPAVCKIQAAITMLQVWSRKTVRLSEIVSAKFYSPVTCDEELLFLCSVAMKNDHTAKASVAVSRNAEKVATFKLVAALENGESGC